MRAIPDGDREAIADRMKAVASNHLATATPTTLKAGPPATLCVHAVTLEGKPIAGARVTLVNGELGLDQAVRDYLRACDGV